MFQLKDFASITLSMINRAKATQSRITDFNVGSVARTLMEASAIEIEEFYQRMFAGIMDAIPVAIYKGFNFALREAAKARGVVVVTFGGPVVTSFVVPAGTIFIAPGTGLRYLSAAAATASVGTTSLSLVVDAADIGSAYNADAGAITAAAGFTFPAGSTITSQPITSGSDGETDTERMTRFIAFIQSISRGTVAAVEYGASTAVIRDSSGAVVEYVTRISTSEVPGRVDVYLYGSGGVPSSALLAEAQKILDGYYDYDQQVYVEGYRAAGVDALALPMTQQPYNLSVTVGLVTGYSLDADLHSAILTAVDTAINAVLPKQTLYVDALQTAVLEVPGVRSVRLDATENVLCPANVVLVPGTITISAGD